ncbi:MAG: PHP domain-containing protein [Bacilli bacterium]|nr:PHP domain-containing protein [Bacilli bacterium]
MIDLHMHTTRSDGIKTPRELIDFLNEKKITVASMTDHNNVDAHVEYESEGYAKFYNGIMIRGTELQTLYNGYIIEILVYNYDLNSFKDYVDYTRKRFWEFHESAYQELLEKAKTMGLSYKENDRPLGGSYYCNMKFQEAIAACYDENKDKVPEKILTDLVYFYRYAFQSPDGMFHIDAKKGFPPLEEVLSAARDSKGITSLAHIDDYDIKEDKIKFLTELYGEHNIDALECFHPVISLDNTAKYMEFAKNNGILISAGSDYHGKKEIDHRHSIDTPAKLEDVTILSKILH